MRMIMAVGALFTSIILAADLPSGFSVLTPQQLTEAARAIAAEPRNRGLAVKTMEVMKGPAAPNEAFAPQRHGFAREMGRPTG